MLVKQYAIDHIKNIGRWSIKRKIVLTSADDYGSIRLNSINSKNAPIEKGVAITQRFDALDSLENNSYVSTLVHKEFAYGWSAAFAYTNKEEIARFFDIISGISLFEKVYGIKPKCFTPPVQHFTIQLVSRIKEWGLEAIDPQNKQKRKLTNNKYRFFTRKQTKLENGLIQTVRNVVFEPNDNRGFNWVDYTFRQAEITFRMNIPANISSHRVNFAGNLGLGNRENGSSALRKLLRSIKDYWPEVEFLSVGELVNEVQK